MNPETPNSMQRRMAAGSSLADTTITGAPGYWARIYISPRKAAHAWHGEIKQRKVNVAATIEQFDEFVEGASFRDIHPSNNPVTASRNAPRNGDIVGDHQSIL